jgi:apolipoprotein D and lipocalin family protein
MAAPVQTSLSLQSARQNVSKKREIRFLGALLLASLLPLTGCVSSLPPKGLRTANNFDAHRFQGTWHEILRYNSRDEAGLTRVTSNYRQQADGKWVVTDRAWKNAEGHWVGSTTSIKDPDKSPGTFRLMFHKPRHVIVIDNDHTLALVCGPNQQDFSIISKSTDPDAARLERIMTQAQAAGFPVREAFWVPTK